MNKKAMSVITATAIAISATPMAFADTGLKINDKDTSINQIEPNEEFKEYIEDVENGTVDNTERVPMPFDVDGTSVSGSVARKSRYLPKDYDPRQLGKDTAVKDQENLGVCWAFAGIAGMESYLATNGYGQTDLKKECHLHKKINSRLHPEALRSD